MNAYEQLELVRDMIFEASEAHWTELNILRRLNVAQRRIALRLSMSPAGWLLERATVTPSASVITLPSNCSKPVYLEEVSSGTPVNWLPGGPSYRRVSRTQPIEWELSVKEAYVLRDTIVVNQDTYTTQCYLWYQKRVPDLHCGHVGSNSGANALELDEGTSYSSGDSLGTGRAIKYVDDYYNDVIVEIIDGTSGITDIRSEITDFVASTGVCTITGTPADNDLYGTISLLPEEAHELMVYDAAISALAKPSAKLDERAVRELRAERKLLQDEFYFWLESRTPSTGRMAIGEMR